MIFERSLARPEEKKIPSQLDSMAPAEIPELISTLQVQLEKVRVDAAFLALKRSELRPSDQTSVFGMMDSREQLRIETSLLAGHAFMIQEMVCKNKIKLDSKSRQILAQIVDYTRTSE